MAEKRIFLYVKDLVILTGKSRATCSRIYNSMRDAFNKGKRQHITVDEYCQYERINVAEIKKQLNIA